MPRREGAPAVAPNAGEEVVQVVLRWLALLGLPQQQVARPLEALCLARAGEGLHQPKDAHAHLLATVVEERWCRHGVVQCMVQCVVQCAWWSRRWCRAYDRLLVLVEPEGEAEALQAEAWVVQALRPLRRSRLDHATTRPHVRTTSPRRTR
eukprot:scaffold82224_cov52-Phaeocystis_antarctica.AAC.3